MTLSEELRYRASKLSKWGYVLECDAMRRAADELDRRQKTIRKRSPARPNTHTEDAQ